VFEIAFERLKNAFNIQKIRLKKKKKNHLFGKKIKSAFKGPKSTFGKSLKMKLLLKSSF
jgi:hypothetical protein